MLCTGCGRLREAAGRSHWLAGAAGPGRSLPVPTAAGAAIQPGSVRARPASPRPPAGAGHAGAASPLAGPGQGRRGARDPDGLCPSAGAGPGLGAVDWTRARDPGSAVQQRRLLWWGRGRVAGCKPVSWDQVASRGKLLASDASRGCSRALETHRQGTQPGEVENYTWCHV